MYDQVFVLPSLTTKNLPNDDFVPISGLTSTGTVTGRERGRTSRDWTGEVTIMKSRERNHKSGQGGKITKRKIFKRHRQGGSHIRSR